jgi:hypothetical protein
MSLAQLRAAIPEKYPIRHYPDITHSWRCEYPARRLGLAYALTGKDANHQSPSARSGHNFQGYANLARSVSSLTGGGAMTT